MKAALTHAGYVYDNQTSIWCRPGYQGIAYSDGDEVEQRLAAIIGKANDLSILSGELRRHCIDWPSRYHLSSARANILRPFEGDLRGDILEIGAGCGAITRYLGECGGNILALEGSPSRASIARSRTRGLDNVIVLSEKFDRFEFDRQFEVITLIGVLEYANLFTEGSHPALTMLERVSSLLKPNGRLIIAIENQLGLKYFAGAPEDHIGQPMYGIEGRYCHDQPQTFGRNVLADLLTRAGLNSIAFLAPFPDYKLPVTIISEHGFNAKDFDAAAFAWQSVRSDPQLPPQLVFSPELVWPTVVQNGLALDLANSFLVVASNGEKSILDAAILAWHFTSERRKQYCKVTRFVRAKSEGIEVQYQALGSRSDEQVGDGPLRFHLLERDQYIYGHLLSQELVQILSRDQWGLAELGAFISRYLNILAGIASSQGLILELSKIESGLPGSFFDYIPQNIIISRDGNVHVIDKEWECQQGIQVGVLIIRALISTLGRITILGRSRDAYGGTYLGLIESIVKGLGWSITKETLDSFANLEASVQVQVLGHAADPQDILDWLNVPIGVVHSFTREAAEQIAYLKQSVARLDAKLAERNAELAAVYSSRSWKITKPIRALNESARAILGR